MRKLLNGTLLAGFLAASQVAPAAPILQDQGPGQIQVNYFEPIGQSFTAEDAFVSFGFSFFAMNQPFPVSDLTLTLLAGDGLDGTVLTSSVFSLAAGHRGFFDVDLFAVSLIAGARYTALLTAVGDSPYWGIDMNNGFVGDLYAGGRLYTSQPIDSSDATRMDARFRVTPTNVPEPSSLLLLGAGLLGVGFARRRRGRELLGA